MCMSFVSRLNAICDPVLPRRAVNNSPTEAHHDKSATEQTHDVSNTSSLLLADHKLSAISKHMWHVSRVRQEPALLQSGQWHLSHVKNPSISVFQTCPWTSYL